MTLRKGQKLINYLRKRFYDAPSLEEQDGMIRRILFYMSDTEIDLIMNMSDAECWKLYDSNVALSDNILEQQFEKDDIKLMKEVNKKIMESKKLK